MARITVLLCLTLVLFGAASTAHARKLTEYSPPSPYYSSPSPSPPPPSPYYPSPSPSPPPPSPYYPSPSPSPPPPSPYYPSPPPPYYTPTTTCNYCNTTPGDLCDFHFEGYSDTVPTFALSGIKGDQAISPFIMYNDPDKSPYSKYYNIVIEVDQGNCAEDICTHSSLGDQFYAKGQESKVLAKTFNSGLDNFVNRCVLLKLSSVQILVHGSDSPVNLNPGDGNQQFPESRRCVVFHTSY